MFGKTNFRICGIHEHTTTHTVTLFCLVMAMKCLYLHVYRLCILEFRTMYGSVNDKKCHRMVRKVL